MGWYSDELARIVAAPNYVLDRDSAQLSVALDGLGRTLMDAASSPGFTGKAGDDASEMFVQQARRARINSDVHGGAARVFAAANEALDRARAQAGNIPVGQMGRSEFSAIVAGGWVLLGPFGAFQGLAGANFANAVLDFNRERHARPIVVALQTELEWLAQGLESRTSELRVPSRARPRDIPEFPYDREEASMSPWDVGWEWLTGEGNSREFQEQDEFTQLLRQHPHYQDLRAHLSAQYDALHVEWESGEEYSYELSGVEGVGKYVADYSTLLTGGVTGNLAVTYLGSHRVKAEVIGRRPDGGYEVRITATNTSSLQSATRPPVIGYQSWYRDTVGEATSQFSEATGIGRTTDQTLVWTETVYP